MRLLRRVYQRFSFLTLFSQLLSLMAIWSTSPLAAQIVNAGSHTLKANKPQQQIIVTIDGGQPVSGVDLFVQIGDGGPELANYGLAPGHRGPRISQIELLEGTIFDGSADVATNIGADLPSQTAIYTVALVGETPSVPAEGVLAKVTLDATGLYHGRWDLLLDGVLPFELLNGPYATNFAGHPADIRNGQLTIEVDLGDFDGNGRINPLDADLLAKAIGTPEERFDLTSDGLVDNEDFDFWIQTIARTYRGDANLDGEFDSGDLVAVFEVGQYEDGVPANSGWADGDWDGNGEFDSSDLVAAFVEGGYERGPRAATVTVPEPNASWLLIAGWVGIAARRKGVLLYRGACEQSHWSRNRARFQHCLQASRCHDAPSTLSAL